MPTRRRHTIAFVLLGFPLVGCSVFDDALLVSFCEPKLFNDYTDEQASSATYRALADQVWSQLDGGCPEGCLEGDYAWGFREGFASYVYAGGNGQPPAVPPRPYWQLDLRSPEGAVAVQSWFDGYRHGARAAREGGYRRAATLKLSGSLRDCDACGCPDEEPTHGGSPAVTPSIPIELDPTGPELIPQPAELVIPHESGGEYDSSEEVEPAAEPGALSRPALEADLDGPQRATVPTAMFQISK